MMKNYLLALILFNSCQLFSQEVYLNVGKNFTKYSYTNSHGQSNSNLQSGTGNFYEIGIRTPFEKSHLLYSYGIALNEYNAVGGNTANSYRWDTQYLGANGGLSYSFFPHQKNSARNLDLILNGGVSGATIVYGKQQINSVYYDLVRHSEFSGIILGSSLGAELNYAVGGFGFISLGYDYSQSINVTNRTAEKLSFTSHQLQLGLHFPIQ